MAALLVDAFHWPPTTVDAGGNMPAAAPEGFRGRVQPAEGTGPPSAYVIVSDGERFVVLRAPQALRALQGQSVAIIRDGKGRLVVGPAPDRGLER